MGVWGNGVVAHVGCRLSLTAEREPESETEARPWASAPPAAPRFGLDAIHEQTDEDEALMDDIVDSQLRLRAG